MNHTISSYFVGNEIWYIIAAIGGAVVIVIIIAAIIVYGKRKKKSFENKSFKKMDESM